MKPYYDVVEIDKTDDKPFEIMSRKIDRDSVETEFLLMLAYKENNENVPLR